MFYWQYLIVAKLNPPRYSTTAASARTRPWAVSRKGNGGSWCHFFVRSFYGRPAATSINTEANSVSGTRRGRLIVIAGPSGVGKGTLIAEVLPRLGETVLARSATTRPRRADEVQGREYYFLPPNEFDKRVAKGEFVEHVQYGNNRYGTLRSEVEGHLMAGRNVMLEIEVEGARNIRRLFADALMIFIAPPSLKVLSRRLTDRHTETAAEVASRMERARQELAAQPEFDYIVINQDINKAADDMFQVIETELREAI